MGSAGREEGTPYRHEIPETERAFYSAATSDIEYKYPFTAPGFGELEGVAYRTDYDLKQHQEHSKTNLEYIDQEITGATSRTWSNPRAALRAACSCAVRGV